MTVRPAPGHEPGQHTSTAEAESFMALGSAGLRQFGGGPPPHTAYRLMMPWWPGLTSGAG